MAEPAHNDEAPASSLLPADQTQESTRAAAEDDALASIPTAPPESEIPAFQAVNARAVAENASTSVDTAAQGSKASDPTPPPQVAAVTQSAPQTAAEPSDHTTASTQADGPDGATSADGATYGTRSRNRTGNARPNYAEDQEMDFEMSSAAATKKKPAPDSAASASQNGVDAKRTRDFQQFLSGSGTATPSSVNGTAGKESTPGAASNPSKKRKAAGPPATLLQTPPASNSPAPTASRKMAASSATARETNYMTFTKHKSSLNKKGELTADDGTKLSVNDHVYLVCEPPGDPYYLCRVMEFLHVRSEDPTSPVDALRVNWYYRPRDIGRFNSDSRLLYATMHSDICPLTSLRGKCMIKHRSEIDDLEVYRKERDAFYFVQVFDRFIRRQYECIPVAQIINVPEKVKKALDERWKFVVVEIGRVKELTSAVKTCKRCTKYCASQDSVDCAICKNSYHMNCVQPPLPKKPSRGFAWACGPCSRASEKKLEQRNTPTVSGDVTEAEEEEYLEEEIPSASNDTTRAPSPSGGDMIVDDHPATQQEIAMAKMWPMRYLGIHARVEDALQYDDRAIYPRASSRLGPRHQANVSMWHGRPVELVRAAEIKKRYTKNNGHKKEGKLTKETIAAMEADREEKAKRPKWVQDEPPGYIARGEDYPNDDPRNTAKVMFAIPEEPEEQTPEQANASSDEQIEEYLRKAKAMARDIGVPPFGINFLDKALELLTAHKFDQDAALKQLKTVNRVKDLHEPVLSKADLIKFEEGVAKYGSEHRLIRLHMKTNLPHADIVRFYYLWKKTPKGREIWGNYGGRKGGSRRRLENDQGAALQQSVAHDVDDSAYDNDKAARKIKGFQCKFCNTTHSRQWRRAPGVSPGQTVAADAKSGKEKGTMLLLALCLRCAGLWRKYAIQWEDIDEVAKKVAAGGGRAWKRKIDEELLRELQAANDATSNSVADSAAGAIPSIEGTGEPAKKKSKLEEKKEKPLPVPKEPTPPPPPIIPSQPQWRTLPCSVCKQTGDTIACAHCLLTVHRNCFGLGENEGVRADGEVKWICEQCSNDRNPQVSTDYACCLCLTEETLIDLVEPPRVSHKKKTDREREKERLEKELADAMRAEYRNKQLSRHRPLMPREPLKRTTGNNWVHVYCAVWTPEIRFSDATILEVAEGFQQIPQSRHEAVCKLCKNKDHQNRLREDKGACVTCFQCHANLHVSCAFEAGYIFGFDVTPVKGSRKDQITTATLAGETGALTAGIWCKEHTVKTIVHPLNEIADAESGKTALQVFAENYKQADLTLTGTVRKANLVQLTKEKGQQVSTTNGNGSRRESTTNNSIAAAVRRGARSSFIGESKSEGEESGMHLLDAPESTSERRCVKCKIDVTPKWHEVPRDPAPKEATPPRSPLRRMSMTLGEIADMERERANGDHANRPSHPPDPPRQNIRFMPPGANGRAWQGMAERFGPTPMANGAPNMHEPLPPQQREGFNNTTNGELYHHHSSTQQQTSTAGTLGPDGNARPMVNEVPQTYLCHKCFLKKETIVTPPPEEKPPPAAVPAPPSPPPRQFPMPGFLNGPAAPPPQAGYEHPPPHAPRTPWDEPPPPSQRPPPVNGLGLSSYGPHPPQPPPGPTYQPFGQRPGPPGFQHSPHAGPPTSAPPPPPMHERHSSFGYGPPPGAANQPPPQYSQPHRPPPLQQFSGVGPPMSNGLTSPRGPPHSQAIPSPTHPPPPHYQGYGAPPPIPRSSESPYPGHFAPMGGPAYGSPQAGRPDPNIGHAPLPQPPPQQPMTPQQHFVQHRGSPQASHSRPESQAGRATTPQGGQAPGTPTLNGAGARESPSVKNLLS